MNDILKQAKELQSEIIANRRALHGFAELGFDLEKTTAYVREQLSAYGIEHQTVGKSGISFTLGTEGPTILLRGDMDALPMPETTGLPFAATNGNSHACGHDCHTAMLLGAAKILNSQKDLPGRVKFMFQPAEELLAGASDMIANGILENPAVDAAFALHIACGIPESKSGVVYHKPESLTFSGDAIKIAVIGQEAHGSTPYLGKDAIYIAAQIITALNSLNNKEVPPDVPVVVLAGKISGGTAVNTVAGRCDIEVSTRSKTIEHRALLLKRVKEISEGVAALYGAKAEVEHWYGMPPMYNNPELDKDLSGYCSEMLGEENVHVMVKFNGTEDFSMVSERVPTVLFMLGVGCPDEGYNSYLHTSDLVVNEEMLPVGSAVYAHCALRWLENNR